jgi:ferrous iron transport protein B
MKKMITVGLVANPNTGKTSLLNTLAGMNLHVGNWPGKTVEKKEGTIDFHDEKIRIVDLPGTYSINPYSNEEKIVREFLFEENPDVIVQIIDVNFLERNLLLTFELLALGKKLILAFNFNKEAGSKGISYDTEKIANILELPIVEIEAHIGENKEELLKKIIQTCEKDFVLPSYFNKIRKGESDISHRSTLDFVKQNILPFYHSPGNDKKSFRIDSWLLHKFLALPIFFLVMYLLFKITFTFSAPIVDAIDYLFSLLSGVVEGLELPAFLASFLSEGIIGGVGSVLSFTPLIFILFLLIAVLEDSGYLARTVILLDRIFHKFGISGQTFLPMILGFGCNVPAIMATRTIQNKKERLIAIYINSFMSCSARLPVYVLFAAVFFPHNATIVIMGLYLFGVFVGLIASFFLSKLIKIDGENTLIIELPPYRWPSLKNIIKHAWWQMSMFVKKAGTLILGAVVIIWLLASFPWGVTYGSEDSWLGRIGQFIAPIFEPLGFGHWSFAIALIFGLVAKEVIIGTMGTLHGVSEESFLDVLPALISPAGALAFLVFVLLYVPCLAVVATMKKETGSWKFTILHALSVTVIAWIASFITYRGALFFGLS